MDLLRFDETQFIRRIAKKAAGIRAPVLGATPAEMLWICTTNVPEKRTTDLAEKRNVELLINCIFAVRRKDIDALRYKVN